MEKTRSVDKWRSTDYIKRAGECLDSAQRDFDEEKWNSCVILAIHAAISAADAFCVHMIGKRNASENHRDAVALFLSIDPNDAEIRKGAARLGSMLKIKTDAEYGERSQTKSEAEHAILDAERFVSFAKKKLA